MKRMIAIVFAFIMLLGIAATALADTATFTNFVLSNGVNGKKQTSNVKKSSSTGIYPTTVVTSISGATSSAPMVARVRLNTGDKATNTFKVYVTNTYWCAWLSGYGKKGDYYNLRMQNTTGGPTITVSGTFTP